MYVEALQAGCRNCQHNLHILLDCLLLSRVRRPRRADLGKSAILWPGVPEGSTITYIHKYRANIVQHSRTVLVFDL